MRGRGTGFSRLPRASFPLGLYPEIARDGHLEKMCRYMPRHGKIGSIRTAAVEQLDCLVTISSFKPSAPSSLGLVRFGVLGLVRLGVLGL